MRMAAIALHPEDDVGVALAPLAAGATVRVMPSAAFRLTVRDAIPLGHKLALHNIQPGSEVRKMGYPIGRATQLIAAGSHVHVHNLASERNRRNG